MSNEQSGGGGGGSLIGPDHPAFFPSGDPTAQLLNTAGIFAAGTRSWSAA